MSETIISIGLLILYVSYVQLITHIQDVKIKKLEKEQREYMEIFKNQERTMAYLNDKIEELKNDIYINK